MWQKLFSYKLRQFDVLHCHILWAHDLGSRLRKHPKKYENYSIRRQSCARSRERSCESRRLHNHAGVSSSSLSTDAIYLHACASIQALLFQLKQARLSLVIAHSKVQLSKIRALSFMDLHCAHCWHQNLHTRAAEAKKLH
jgi:hypothetical protein